MKSDRIPSINSLGFRLENFRAFQDSGFCRIGPLTCLVGANSSGKSSIISALLLLKQSLTQKSISRQVSPLALNGPFCELGNFSDVVHRGNASGKIAFSFSFPLSDFEFYRKRDESIVKVPIPRAPDDYANRYYLRYYDEGDVKLPKKGAVEIRIGFADDEPFGPSLSEVDVKVGELGSLHCVRTISGARRQHWRAYVDGLPPRSIRQRFSPYAFFPIFRANENPAVNKNPGDRTRVLRFIAATERAFWKLTRIIADSEVTGPFRTPPERRYQFGGFSATSGGPSGEQAVDILITEQLLKTAGKPLQSHLSYWLKRLGLAKGVAVKDLARKINLFELSLSGAGSARKANVADVGFGISQVLPVLLQGLLVRPGGIYMVQQPEIHLHPDAQASLADYFLFLSSRGVRVIVETHSEYLLLRLRRRLAEGRLSAIENRYGGVEYGSCELRVSDVSVLLTSASRKDGTSVKELLISNSFQFENLPKGFMNRSVEDRLALLGAVAQRK